MSKAAPASRPLPLASAVFAVACSTQADVPPAVQSNSDKAATTAESTAGPRHGASATTKIAMEDIAHHPRPATNAPRALAFTADDSHLTYLHSPDGTLNRQLFAIDLDSGASHQIVDPPGGGVSEDELSLEEKLRRERTRSRGLGITRYAWAKDADRMLIPVLGDLFVQDGIDGELRPIVDRQSWCARVKCDPHKPAIDPKMTRDGTRVAFVFDDEIYVVSAEPGGTAPQQITHGARGTGKTHGLAEYVAQEEMSRHSGYWWSHDGSAIAFTEVDETHIPVYRIVHQGSHAVGEEAQEDHRYPFAGSANARVRLGVVSSNGGPVQWMKIDIPDGGYLARVNWMPDGSLTAQVQNRAQTQLTLLRLNPKTGATTEILRETSKVWINLHRNFRPLERGPHAGGFIWSSERTGFSHLYLYDATGETTALTSGEWMVEGIRAVDEDAGRVWFMATKDSPLERHLYVTSFAGSEPTKVTTEPGVHAVTIDHGRKRFVDQWSTTAEATRQVLRDLETGEVLRELWKVEDPKVTELGLTPPQLVTLNTRDGVQLYGALYEPDRAVHGAGPYPTMVSVYGGPHAQRVTNSFGLTTDLQAQALRERGYVVFKLDNRGSAHRGVAFEGALKHDMGNIEVQDQVDGVRWLVERGLTNPDRVGITGWSYGGYMSAMALARAPETFKLGVAGAPVSHWDGYDTHYTERYMGTPQDNPEGYANSAVMKHVENMTGRLLIVHGLIDENVHFRHSARLMNALIEHQKDYDLLLFPDARHGPRKKADRVYLNTRVFAYIAEYL